MFLEMFDNAEHAAKYADGPAKFMPGFFDLHRMAIVLMRETVPRQGRVLVHGAGGGLELEALAQANTDWKFVGVDPAKAMLDAARQRLEKFLDRIDLHHGFVDTAPDGPFDGATSLLTLHFLDAYEREQAIAEIVRRLRPGAPFIVAHSSFPQDQNERETWLRRYRDFGVLSGVDPEMAETARAAVSSSLPIFDPSEDVAILQNAGLSRLQLFYAAFTWRGWIGYAD